MSGRDKAAPLGMILVLVICAGSLAVHFVAEGWLTQAQSSIFDMTAESGDFDSEHEHSEDYFVVRSVNFPGLENFFAVLNPQSQFHTLSIHISPLLPPPNF